VDNEFPVYDLFPEPAPPSQTPITADVITSLPAVTADSTLRDPNAITRQEPTYDHSVLDQSGASRQIWGREY
jgi:hypothetical protein